MTQVELSFRDGLNPVRRAIAKKSKREELCPTEGHRQRAKLSVQELVISYEDVQSGELTEAVHKCLSTSLLGSS